MSAQAIQVNAGRAAVSGAMTLATAKALLDEGSAALAGDVSAFDLSAVGDVDSSALAVLFGWVREAQRLGKAVRVEHLPASLASLAEVYGVSDLLPLA